MRLTMGMIVKNRFSELKRNLYHNSQFFDEVIVVSDSSDEAVNLWLTSDEARALKITAILDFEGYQTIRLRQRYLDAAEKGGWMMRLDVDEFISMEGGYKLREVAQKAEENNYNMVSFKVVDVYHNIDGSTRIGYPDFYCPNFFKLTNNIKYVGQHHEGVDLGIPINQVNVSVPYYHIRSEASVYLRGARNAFSTAFTTGGNGNLRAWTDFRQRCAGYSITEFCQLEDLMRKGTVPEDITEWFILHRNSDSTEYRAYFVAYYILLHPELNQFMGNVDFPTYDFNRKPYNGEMSF